jgi:drug/metabolite transporter (DMT)-like permease
MKALGAEQNLLAPAVGSFASSLATLSARFAMAALAILAFARFSPLRINREEWKHGAVLAGFTAVSMFLQVDGINYTLATTAGFLIALYCVLVPLFTWLAGWRRMTPVLFACCLLVVAGMAALTGIDPRKLSLGRGEWENLGAACLFAGQILWVDRVPAGRVAPERVTFVLLALVALSCATALAFLPGGLAAFPAVHASPRALILTAALALFGTALPFILMNRFQTKVGSVTAGFIYCSEPLVTSLAAFWLPELLVREASLYRNESATPRLLAGGALILAANLLLLRDKQGKGVAEPALSG